MARLARVVDPEIPYHITRRGNRRARTFVYDTAREAYLALLERHCHAHGLHIHTWAWCLMSNGSKDFITRLESELERILKPQPSGRKAKASADKDLTDDMFAELWEGCRLVSALALSGSSVNVAGDMARLARVVVPEIPYHITHRGNRRARTFVYDTDREAYLAWLERYRHAHGLHIGTWCLMSNGSKDFITRLESELEHILQPQRTGRKAMASADKDLTDDIFAELWWSPEVPLQRLNSFS